MLREGRLHRDGTKAELLTSETLTELFGLGITVTPRGDWYHADIID
jgi:iron complex transport system ATP-binding protein